MAPGTTTAAQKPVFSPDQLRERLRPFVGADCDPPAVAEALARRYRFVGYVPIVEASCGSGTLSVSIRESIQTIDLITFDAGDLARLGITRDPSFQENRGLYPVPRDAPRAVLRGLIQTREGDLYNFERYRGENEALRRLGYAIAVIPGSAAPLRPPSRACSRRSCSSTPARCREGPTARARPPAAPA